MKNLSKSVAEVPGIRVFYDNSQMAFTLTHKGVYHTCRGNSLFHALSNLNNRVEVLFDKFTARQILSQVSEEFQQKPILFSYDELDDEAKAYVRETYFYSTPYYDWDDAFDALTKFCDAVGVTLRNWETRCYKIYLSTTEMEEYVMGMSPWRSRIWAINNILPLLRRGKFYHKGDWVEGEYISRHRHSKIQFDYVLNGFWIEHSLLSPLLSWIDNWRDDSHLYDIIQGCIQEWSSSVEKDMYYQDSEDNIRELCELNEYLFLENGKLS